MKVSGVHCCLFIVCPKKKPQTFFKISSFLFHRRKKLFSRLYWILKDLIFILNCFWLLLLYSQVICKNSPGSVFFLSFPSTFNRNPFLLHNTLFSNIYCHLREYGAPTLTAKNNSERVQCLCQCKWCGCQLVVECSSFEWNLLSKSGCDF